MGGTIMRIGVSFAAFAAAFLIWLIFAVSSMRGDPPVVGTPEGEGFVQPAVDTTNQLELAALRARVRSDHRRLVAARRTVRHLQARLTSKVASIVWLVQGFECIHSGEGSWTAATGNGYYGGLQMDLGFQQTYAPELFRRKGTANRWTPAEQIAAAIAAHASRGFEPWPATARRCGLL
jgi:hypothetical protein